MRKFSKVILSFVTKQQVKNRTSFGEAFLMSNNIQFGCVSFKTNIRWKRGKFLDGSFCDKEQATKRQRGDGGRAKKSQLSQQIMGFCIFYLFFPLQNKKKKMLGPKLHWYEGLEYHALRHFFKELLTTKIGAQSLINFNLLWINDEKYGFLFLVWSDNVYKCLSNIWPKLDILDRYCCLRWPNKFIFRTFFQAQADWPGLDSNEQFCQYVCISCMAQAQLTDKIDPMYIIPKWSIRATEMVQTWKLGRIRCSAIIWHKKKRKLPPWWPKWQLLIYISYINGSKYMRFLTLFATRAGGSRFAAFLFYIIVFLHNKIQMETAHTLNAKYI